MFLTFWKRKPPRIDPRQQFLERQRIQECDDVVSMFLEFFGYIAREVITKDELTKLIAYGVSPDTLADNIKQRIANKKALILGEQIIGPVSWPVKLTDNYRERHVYAIGRSGSGKTNLLRGMILQDILWGNGVGVLAPEQEMLTEEILPYIPEDRVDDVIYVNPADTERPIPFNPLHLDLSENIDLKVDELLTIFNRIMGEAGPRMGEILRQTFYALLERKGSTLLDIEKLLDRQDGKFRGEIIKTTRDEQTAHFFKNVYPTYPKDAGLPITTRIGRLVRPRLVRTLLCQPGKCLNIREAMDDGKILLFNLSDGLLGEQTSQLLGQLIVSKIQMAVMSRADTAIAARRPFYLYLDEFQTFTGVAGASYEKLLSRARKYKLGLILAHQQTGQIPRELLHEIFGNVSTFVSFAISHDDAQKISKELLITVQGRMQPLDPGELVSLRTGQAYAKIGSNTFFLKTRLVDLPPNQMRAKEIIEQSRLNYGVPPDKRPPREEPPPNEPKEEPKDDIDPDDVF